MNPQSIPRAVRLVGVTQPGMCFAASPNSDEGREAAMYGRNVDGWRYLGYGRRMRLNHEEAETNERREADAWRGW